MSAMFSGELHRGIPSNSLSDKDWEDDGVKSMGGDGLSSAETLSLGDLIDYYKRSIELARIQVINSPAWSQKTGRVSLRHSTPG